jgi:serine/threonine protein kinase
MQIVMEYCAAGSLSDINEAIHRVLNEDELRAVVAYTVLGLHHLHTKRSIHRVISFLLPPSSHSNQPLPSILLPYLSLRPSLIFRTSRPEIFCCQLMDRRN